MAAMRASTRRGESYFQLAGKRRVGRNRKTTQGVVGSAFLPMAATAFGGRSSTKSESAGPESDGPENARPESVKPESERSVKFSIQKENDDKEPEASE